MLQYKFVIWAMLCSIIFFAVNPAVSQEENKSTDSTDFKPTINAYPYVYYTPETQLAFGTGGVVTFYAQKNRIINPSSITVSGFYSTIKTYELSISSQLYFAENKNAATIDLTYGHSIDRFYGIGNNTPELGTEEFVIDNTGGMIDFQSSPFLIPADRSGIVVEYRNYAIVDRKYNPYLDTDSLNGSKGGKISGLGLVLIWDQRDHVFFPNNGKYTQVRAVFYTQDFGSDYTFTSLEIDSRRYWSFQPDHVLALQFYLITTGGNPPFFKLPALGGSRMMRGYYLGRYRDKDYLSIQLEYRQYFWGRFGFAAFVGTGDVGEDITNLSVRNLKPSYGAGLRFLFNKEQKINLRADIGFVKNTNGIYLGIEEVF
ncbi:MAG: hypothetical protein E4H13_04240 [Calditrichales bacterium]|nr:MAG: hypothetical protein E4H13_04240 [Calditrichales bacterium]